MEGGKARTMPARSVATDGGGRGAEVGAAPGRSALRTGLWGVGRIAPVRWDGKARPGRSRRSGRGGGRNRQGVARVVNRRSHRQMICGRSISREARDGGDSYVHAGILRAVCVFDGSLPQKSFAACRKCLRRR